MHWINLHSHHLHEKRLVKCTLLGIGTLVSCNNFLTSSFNPMLGPKLSRTTTMFPHSCVVTKVIIQTDKRNVVIFSQVQL